MAAAVRRLADESGLAASLSRHGRLRVEEHFDEARSHERLREEIELLIAPRRAASGRGQALSVESD
jgi:hypothetical protein